MNAIAVKEMIVDLIPPLLWRAVQKARGRWREPDRRYDLGGVTTNADPAPVFNGRFDALYSKYYALDPHSRFGSTRYRAYNVAKLAELCRNVPGDFVCCGVSYGIAPRVVFDYVDLPSTGKTLHLVDPFEGTLAGGTIAGFYNTNPDFVRGQYPDSARIEIHRAYIPQALPLPGVNRIAFCFNNTGDAEADAASLPTLYDALSPGGAIITDQYGNGRAHYRNFVATVGEPFWLPTGQAVFFKR